MFYYPNVLQRHTGCFSTIWLAATKGIKITRREFLKVNIGRTCEDIIDYVKVQVPPIHPSLPRPRFSLYLSCQLQYGVILVYHRQCGFLLEEVQQAIRHLLRSERHSKIDMQEPDRLGLNLPDSLFLLEEAEGALAPFFGKMGDECEMPSPYQLPQAGLFIMASSPECPLKLTKEDTPGLGHIASPETITIRDKEPVPILTAEFGGAELPEATAYEIDLLMEQQDQFFLGEVEDKERERAGDGETTRELGAAMVSIEQLKADVSAEDRSWTVENPERPLEATKSKARVETTPPPVTLPDTTEASERDLEPEKDTEHCSSEIPVAEVRIPPGKQGRRRQLIFIDQHTQISQDAMREQINNHLIETRSLSDVLLPKRLNDKFSSSHLLSSPCNMLLSADLQSLWKMSCIPIIRPSPTKRRRLQEDSELSEMERERGENRERESSIEVLRESADAALLLSEISAASDVVLDGSKGDKYQSDVITPSSRRSPQEDAAVHMEAILEEHLELPQGFTETEITPQSLLRMLNSHINCFGKVFFSSLVPPEVDRSSAAHVFYKVLELTCERKLSVKQSEPYGPITISRARL
ncbi:hypothetical protein AMEX_G8043 [Astyanax mexicanus]|uniref:REC8 meiotic recombination protein b n=1 Tax=Astyanax mexicanus TaxID=7994 RepID=A0A8T2LVS9_ASTMX|nr:hypothetical protein AMEX_G8043 [Astyanax mexicanus]